MYRLTVAGIKAIKSPGRYGDGFGLYLCVGKRQSRSWIVRVQKSGRRRDIGLGSATKVSLAEARKRAVEIRRDIDAGIDPVAERRKAQGIPTFRDAAARVFEQNRKTWRNGHHQWQWMRTLEMFAFPAVGDLPVSEITAPMIRDLLSKIWLEKPETARRVRQRIGVVLDWAYSKGWRETEAPMRSITKGLPAQPKKKRHHAALPYTEVPKFLKELVAQDVTASRLALRLLILTASRSGEVRSAEWREIDVKRKLWTIAAEKMKAGKEHIVPLSNGTLEVLEMARKHGNQRRGLVFPGQKLSKPLSDMAMVKVMRDMNVPATPHGFRSSFRDWAAERTSYPGEVAEAALAHAVTNKVEAAYRRTDYLEKRRDLMRDWETFCLGKEEV